MSWDYIREISINWDEIWWVTNSLDELVSEGVLFKEEAQNLIDSLYYGEHHKDFTSQAK